jgi:Ca-activated chloride channel family protein
MTHSRCWTRRLTWSLAAVPVVLALWLLLAVQARTAEESGEPIELLFLYGSEKQKWLEDVTEAYRKTHPTVEGRPVQIKLKAMGSGETMDELLEEGTQAHLVSPASGAYLELGNARARALRQPALVGPVRPSLVRSPVVIAMWKRMAQALGWPDQPIGWKDLYDLANTPNAWAARGFPQWGSFRLGHTHPESSNSGLIALFSQVYAAAGKRAGLTVADVQRRETGDLLKVLQRSVIHYGSSTGFFADTMFTGDGPSFLSAAVLYENLVVQSYTQPSYASKLTDEVVAIYPKEGTFWSDHPVAVVERDWVSPAHRQAASDYVRFLLQPEQQRKALQYGFRPGVAGLPLGSPIEKRYGVDPDKPAPAEELKPPSVEVMNACLEAWKKNKRKARVVLVLDASTNMIPNGKELRAREGAEGVIKALGPGDWLAIVACHNSKVEWIERGLTLRGEADRKDLLEKVSLGSYGKRRLYDAIGAAQERLKEHEEPEMSSAIVVLTDGGPDHASLLKLEALRDKIKASRSNRHDIRIYTFAYCPTEQAAREAKHLKEIAEDSRAKAFVGNPETVRRVLRELAASF